MLLSPGDKLGPFEILGAIGAGGMGEVWKARDTRLGRIVAIKRLNTQHSARFEQEARAIAALNHPHICQIHDVGADYLVLEFIEGQPLKGPVTAERALLLATQIASALEAAHKRGILAWPSWPRRPATRKPSKAPSSELPPTCRRSRRAENPS